MTAKNSEKMRDSPIRFYETEVGKISVEVRLHDNTLWLTQKQMGELFSIDVKTVQWHLKNIFKSAELEKNQLSGITR